MHMKSCRKLTVLDAMILVAATAPALAVMRRQWPLGWDQRAYWNFCHSIRFNLYVIG